MVTDSFIKFLFVGKTSWQVALTIWVFLFYAVISPMCLAIAIVGVSVYGVERWLVLVGRFNSQPFIKRVSNLFLPVV